jgi:magnesium transporter
MTAESTSPWLELERLIDAADVAGLRGLLGRLSAPEAALGLSRLDDGRRARLLALLTPAEAAALVGQFPDAQATEVLERLEPGLAAGILNELPSAAQADLLGDLGDADAEAILEAMQPEEARQARALRRYPDESAGGLMVVEYLAYPEGATVGQVVSDLRAHAARYRDYVVQYAFVVDPQGRLAGVLRLRDLLFSPPDRPIRDLMARETLFVRDTDSLNDLRAFFDRRPLYGVPVVDAGGRLVGIVQRHAVEEALAERMEDAFLKTQGIVGGEELRSMPFWRRSRRRLAWLSVNVLLNVVSASVIAVYEQTLAAVIALAVFLPIISDMSGCSGNQAVAVSMRELSLGLLRPTEVLRVWLKEVSVGLINGLALGLLIAAVAWTWKGNPFLGLVVGTALMLNTIVAVSIGGAVPLVLRRVGADPALASGPILTTITDMCGFFFLLSIAGALLPRLVAG